MERARRNLTTAAEILDGTRDLETGRPKQRTGFTFPPRQELSQEEMDREEYLALYCDEDGDLHSPPPKWVEEDFGRDWVGFERHMAAWEADERARIARAEENKRRIWSSGLPERRDRLAAIEAMPAPQLTERILETARAIFDWMRTRVAAARGTLGEDHPLSRQMRTEWRATLAACPRTQDQARQDLEDRRRDLVEDATPIWQEGARLWEQVEQRREAAKQLPPAPSPYSGPGPSM